LKALYFFIGNIKIFGFLSIEVYFLTDNIINKGWNKKFKSTCLSWTL